MNYIIRKYNLTDKSQLLSINDEWSDGIKSIFETYNPDDNNVEVAYIAESGNLIIGFIYGYILPTLTLIPHFLYIRPEYRNNGIGNELLQMLERKSGCKFSQIYYEKSMTEHYERHGYMEGENLRVAIKELL